MPAENLPQIDAIRTVVARLSRPHRSGGAVIERAAIMAEGAASTDILAWIVAHAGEPEVAASKAPARGLYGTGFGGGVTAPRGPSRYVLPAAALAVPARRPRRRSSISTDTLVDGAIALLIVHRRCALHRGRCWAAAPLAQSRRR